MDTLTGKEAQNVRNDWREKLADPAIRRQRIIHVIPLTRGGAFFDTLPACQIWRRHRRNAVAAALKQLMTDSAGWPYIDDALAVHDHEGKIIRIVIAPQAGLDDPDSYQLYWGEVHGRFFAARCHEEVWMLTAEQVAAAGLAVLGFDVNILGANGIMRTRYDNSGNIIARDYYDWELDDPQADYVYIMRMVNLARKIGRRIHRAELPEPAAPAAAG